jgi:hypothetical protein
VIPQHCELHVCFGGLVAPTSRRRFLRMVESGKPAGATPRKLPLIRGLDCRPVCPPFAEEKAHVPRAALAAAERPQKSGQKNSPPQNAAVGAQHVLTAAKRALPGSHLQRDCMNSGHKKDDRSKTNFTSASSAQKTSLHAGTA